MIYIYLTAVGLTPGGSSATLTFLALQGAPYIYDISRLRVNVLANIFAVNQKQLKGKDHQPYIMLRTHTEGRKEVL
jgi:hypothetical protein